MKFFEQIKRTRKGLSLMQSGLWIVEYGTLAGASMNGAHYTWMAFSKKL